MRPSDSSHASSHASFQPERLGPAIDLGPGITIYRCTNVCDKPCHVQFTTRANLDHVDHPPSRRPQHKNINDYIHHQYEPTVMVFSEEPPHYHAPLMTYSVMNMIIYGRSVFSCCQSESSSAEPTCCTSFDISQT